MSTTLEPVTLVEWFNEHWYKVSVNGGAHYLPSVTTKLGILDKPFLARWRGDVGNREADLRMNEASNKGKRIHYAWYVALKSGAVVYDPWQSPIYTPEQIADLNKKYDGLVSILRTQEEMWEVYKLSQQFKILKPEVVCVEQIVYDIETKDAGTIDHVYRVIEGDYAIAGQKPLHLPGGIVIGDLKSGAAIYDEAWYQTAKYLDMFEKKNGIKTIGTMITHSNASTRKGVPGLNTLFHSREQVMDEDLPMFKKIASVWESKHKDDQPETYQLPSIIQLRMENK